MHTGPEKDEESAAEQRRLRRLQLLVALTGSVLSQDPELTPERASAVVDECRNAALAMFPGKELAFDLIYKPRLERLINERFRTS